MCFCVLLITFSVVLRCDALQVSHGITAMPSSSLRIRPNASVNAMDAAFESSSIAVDGNLKIINFVQPLGLFLQKYLGVLFSTNACLVGKKVVIASGTIMGAGNVVMIKKHLLFSSSSSLTWSGPTLVLKFASVLEYSAAVEIDADIVFENAKLRMCAASPAAIATSRAIFVKSIQISPHEIPYDINIIYIYKSTSYTYRATAFLSPDFSCQAPIFLKSA